MPRRLSLALALAVGGLGGCFLSPNVPPSFRYACGGDEDCAVLTCLGDAVDARTAKEQGLKSASELEKGCDAPEAKADPSGYYEYRQSCTNGLCEYPCALESFQADCPGGKGYNFCLNGSCSHFCGTNTDRYPDVDSTCPDPQSCLIFGDDIDLDGILAFLPSGGGGSSSSNPFGSSGVDFTQLEGSGVCGLRCDAEDALPCPAGYYCPGAMCLPGCDKDGATPCAEGSTCIAFGGFSACLATCDPAAATPCPEGQICAPVVNVCVDTCASDSECADGLVCDPDLMTCVPDAGASSSGSGG